MSHQPIERLIARSYGGVAQDAVVAVALRCGCIISTTVDVRRVDEKTRSMEGALPCPVGHAVPSEPAAARCSDCGAELRVEVRDCDGGDDNVGWTGDLPCGHLASVLQQLQLVHGSYPWRPTPGWYCMACSFPPR
jgi:hypothetical protein